MTDHLPECQQFQEVHRIWCICDLLYTCKQRVLDAAREAVASLEPLLDRHKSEGGYDCCGCVTPGYLWADAIDAIDALKESK